MGLFIHLLDYMNPEYYTLKILQNLKKFKSPNRPKSQNELGTKTVVSPINPNKKEKLRFYVIEVLSELNINLENHFTFGQQINLKNFSPKQVQNLSELFRIYLIQNYNELRNEQIQIEIQKFNEAILTLFMKYNCKSSLLDKQIQNIEPGISIDFCLDVWLKNQNVIVQNDQTTPMNMKSKIQKMMSNIERDIKVLETINEESLEEIIKSVRELEENDLQQSILFSNNSDSSKQDKLLTKLIQFNDPNRSLDTPNRLFGKISMKNEHSQKKNPIVIKKSTFAVGNANEIKRQVDQCNKILNYQSCSNKQTITVRKNINTGDTLNYYNIVSDLNKIKKDLQKKKLERHRLSKVNKIKKIGEDTKIWKKNAKIKGFDKENYTNSKLIQSKQQTITKRERNNQEKKHKLQEKKSKNVLLHKKSPIKNNMKTEKNNGINILKKLKINEKKAGINNFEIPKREIYAVIDMDFENPKISINEQFKFSEHSKRYFFNNL